MASLKYGDVYHIQNGYAGWEGGFLDVCGRMEFDHSLYKVQTSRQHNRDNGSGMWKIVSANGKKDGEPVMSDDIVYLVNQYSGNGGYLDVCGTVSDGNLYALSTAKSSDRDHGSGTWQLFTNTPGGEVQEGEVIHLQNGYADWKGGFLDTRGHGPDALCVSTTARWNRDQGSTYWRFQK